MTGKYNSVSDALVAAGLVAVTFGIFLILADYVALSGVARLFERWAMLPAGWRDAHLHAVELGAIILALGPAAYIGARMYRLARRYNPDA